MESARLAVPRGALYIASQGAASYAVSFLTYVVLTRLLTPTEVGKIPLLSAIMAVFTTFTILSLQTATTKFVSEYAGTGRLELASGVIRTAMKLVAYVSIPAFLLLAVLSPQVSGLVFGTEADAPLVALALLAAFVSDFGSLLVSALWGLNLFGKMVTCSLAGMILGRAFGVFLAWIGLGLEGYVNGLVIGAATTLMLAIICTRARFGARSELASAKSMLVYSYPILFTTLIGLVQQWADVTVLYAVTGSLVFTGVYYLAFAGAGVLSIVASAVSGAIFPTLSAMHGRQEAKAFRAALEVSQRVLNVSVIPIGFALAAISYTAVGVAYGPTYLAAAIPFAILVGSSIVPAYASLMTVTLQAIGWTRPLIRIWSAAALTEVVLTAGLVLPLGVAGSAVARLCMSGVAVVLAYSCVKGEWWPRIDWHSLAKGIVVSALVALVLFPFDFLTGGAFHIRPLIRVLLDGVVFLLMYAVGLIALKPLVPQDLDLLRANLPAGFHRWLDVIERRTVSGKRIDRLENA